MFQFIPLAIEIIKTYGYIFVFFGTFFGGEVFMLAATFLASLGVLNIFLVMVVGLAGILISDSVWYLIGRKSQKFFTYVNRFCRLDKHKHRFCFVVDHFNNNYEKFLFLSKFIYGIRLATIIASGHQLVPYKKFFRYNAAASVIWVLLISGLGSLMGLSWQALEKYNSHLRWLVVLGLLILFVLRYIANKIIKFNGGKYESGS